MAGVIPVIFASSLLYLPSLLAQFQRGKESWWADWINNYLTKGDHPLYMAMYFGLIVFFTYFYVAITFNPDEVAENMKKYGGFIPGIRAGRPTADYLSYVLSRITLPGSLYLGIVSMIPLIAFVLINANQNFPLGGTDPHRGRGRPGDREADRSPVAAKTLRRGPAVRLILFGPPGAGKGTQAARLAVRLDVPAISTGEIFRGEVSRGTELGTLAKSYMDAGKYVPDEVVNGMVAGRLAEPDAKAGFLLDGYPRTSAQAQALQDVLAEASTPLDAVVEITADTRPWCWLLKRAGIEGRADDTEPVIRKRMEVYAESANALRDFYAARGLLRQVDGMGEIDTVTGRLLAALGVAEG